MHCFHKSFKKKPKISKKILIWLIPHNFPPRFGKNPNFTFFWKFHLEKIANGDVLSVSGESLPTYIICQNKQAMKLRKTRRIMQIPCFTPLSKEDKYSKGTNLI